MSDVIQCVVPCHNQLGEGPVWSEQHQALFWVDIKKHELHQWTPSTNTHKHSQLTEQASSLAVQNASTLLVATATGLYDFSLHTGAMKLRQRLEPDRPNNRSNEGKCDPSGRFWVGTMDDTEQAQSGALYMYNQAGELIQHLDGIGISNTLAWSPTQTTMYFADSMAKSIYAFDFDPLTGTPSNQRLFYDTKGEAATPDGSAIDAEGYLWNCQWDGWRIVRIAPDGSVDREIELPVQRPTSCAFGGKDGSTLYITSARIGLTPEQLETQPHAGGVFMLETDIQGGPVPSWGRDQPSQEEAKEAF